MDAGLIDKRTPFGESAQEYTRKRRSAKSVCV